MSKKNKDEWVDDDAYTYATGSDSEMNFLVIILVAILVIAYIITH